MKGVILAGGTGSRLYPLTKVTNKHLLPVGKFPMIYFSIYKLIECFITDIIIVTGQEHMGDVVKLLGSGKAFGVDLSYKVQDRAGGIAEALGLAESFCRDEKMVVLLGDNIFEDSIVPFVNEFREQEKGARILLKEVSNPTRFGVAQVKGKRIISIVEKPKKPKSKLCVSGIYMYDSQVFEIIKQLHPSARNELEITDVNNHYLNRQELYYNVLQGWWGDAGTFPSLKRVNQLVDEADFIPQMEKIFDCV